MTSGARLVFVLCWSRSLTMAMIRRLCEWLYNGLCGSKIRCKVRCFGVD